MFEIKDLAKTYTPKNGVPVQALKGINLSFGETGLVFVLGKSGSGKSTLLNLIGGLDSADKGEIVIKGKSSKDFKTVDYDAYRNMYVGFVFQEYNILNEFTVGENISLAIELQNKKENKELLTSILKEVDLEGYADRKPNELSGGQKQRVAIARALIKSPQIVLADEPTGALDSNTGKAIFDTLKKISKEKLVIVVSHDREFAEEYGDRVIELADGEVISDLQKDKEGKFSPTDNQALSKANEKYDGKEKFAKSRLPYRYAIKMGASSIKSKPIRLAVTILLCFVTFSLFGVVDIFNAFNARKILLDAYTNGDYSNFAYTASMQEVGDVGYRLYGVSQQDLDFLNTKSSNEFLGVTYLNDKYGRFAETSLSGFLSQRELEGSNNSVYYSQCLYGFLPASKEFFSAQGFELIGEAPASEDEIVLTQYILDQFNIAGITLKEPKGQFEKQKVDIVPNKNRTAQEFVDGGYYIELDGQDFKIVGIVDTKADPQGKFDSLKPSTMTTANSRENTNLIRECQEYFQYSYHSLGYIFPKTYEKLVESHKVDMTSWNSFGRALEGSISYTNKSDYRVVASDKDLDKTAGILWLDGKERDSLQDNEIVVGLNYGVKLLTTNYDSSLTYKHSKSEYFDGLLRVVEEISFWDLTRGTPLACIEEAERVDIEKLEPFKRYLMDMDEVNAEWALRTCYSAPSSFFWSSSNFIRIDSSRLEYDFDKMSEEHWRLAYAGYLGIDEYGFYVGEGNNKIEYSIEGGRFNNITGLPSGELVDKIGNDRLYVQGKISLGNIDVINSNSINITARDLSTSQLLSEDYEYWSIVGIYVPRYDYPELDEKDTVIFNNALYRKAEGAQEIIYNYALASIPTAKSEILSLIDLHLEGFSARNLRLNDNAAYVTSSLNSLFYAIKMIMLMAGAGVAIFSILLMSNYIAMSISNRKREIGILRALGAKTSDVFSIFANESIIMALINTVLSVFVALGASIGLNKFFQAKYSADFTILSFGIRQVAIILLISVATAILSSLIPIYRLSKKKPIDCIQDR